MLGRPTRLVLVALVALAAVTASPGALAVENMSPNAAAMTAFAETAMAVTDKVIEKYPELVAKFGAVKDAVRKSIQSGAATHDNLFDPLVKFANENEAKYRGLGRAMTDSIKSIKFSIHKVSKVAPEASWDYRYYATKLMATKIQNGAILKKLEALNAELEGDFQRKTDADTIIAKIDKFYAEAEALSPGFQGTVDQQIESDIEAYNAGRPLPTTTLPPSKIDEETPKPTTEAPKPTTTAAAANSTAPATTEPTATTVVAPGSSSSTTGSGSGLAGSSTAPAVEAPKADQAPKPTTGTPAPKSNGAASSSSSSLTAVAAAALVAGLTAVSWL